jgi:WD40 repeat protein/transcriptional regulator with XRE-family HTH domain
VKTCINRNIPIEAIKKAIKTTKILVFTTCACYSNLLVNTMRSKAMNSELSFGRFVRQRRRELDLTQEELARRVGCAAITIRKIEADDARASVQIAERLAMALAIPLDERAEFVRQARAARIEAPDQAETAAPAFDEIGRADLTGRAIRGYALAEKVGAGGMGAVYRAIQPLVEREVAIKIILPAFANHPDFIRRFEAEAQLVARLEHPHIVPLYDYWREPGVAYLVMRLLRGGSVQALLASGPLPIESVARMLEQICAALHSAHRIGIIHRDLKPGNVLLDEDNNAYLADFGIAKNLGSPDLESQTQVDALVGSPQYMSPEQIRSLSVRPQTDIYCLGVMLYEMLSGALPFNGPTPFDLLQQHVNAPLPSLAAHRSGLPAALDMVISRAAAKDPDERYPDALALLDGFHRALDGALTHPIFIPAAEEKSSAELINPYKGLRAFSEADADDFFGRETLVQQLLARLGEGGELTRFLAVVGPSGSGKSSVVKAGLMPALRRGGLPDSENWFLVDLIPGPHPFEELEAALLRMAANPPASLLAQLKENERGLLRAVNRILPADPSIELVLVIDQFEEVFTLLADEAERALLLNSLVTAALDERSRVRIVITLRADFIDRPLRYVDFGELIQRRNELVLPLTPDEVERAILGPAQRAGLRLEPGLVAAMIHDVGDQPGGLPLLQYALTELFEKCIVVGATHASPLQLTKAAYTEIGGVLGALGRRAEEVYTSLDQAGQAATRQLFLRLVTLGEGVEDTRRRALRAELESLTVDRGPQTEDEDRLSSLLRPSSFVIDAFAKHRLLSIDRDPLTRGATVEVAHEALIRVWSRLREWLNDCRADVRMQRQLAIAAAEWTQARQDASFLLTGAHLEQFEGWAAEAQIALTPDEHAYLDSSILEREHQQTEETERQRRELEAAQKLAETERQSIIRLRLRNRVITTVGVIALVLALLAGLFGLQSYQNAQLANQNAQSAEQNARRAEQAATLASVRELAASAISNLTIDPERSVLLALQAVETTYSADKTVLPEAEAALHQAVQASHLQFTLAGHAGQVLTVAFSPNGTRVATFTDDGTVKIWDTTNGAELFSFAGHSPKDSLLVAGYTRLAFSPDGAHLAATDVRQVKIWEVASGKELLTIPDRFNFDVSALTYSPDGVHIAYADGFFTYIADVLTGKTIFSLKNNAGAARALTYTQDGLRLAIVSGVSTNNNMEVWDAETGKQLVFMNNDASNRSSGLRSIVLSPDGTRLFTATSGGLQEMWDVATQKKLPGFLASMNDAAAPLALIFSPDGTRLASGDQSGTATIWDATTGQELLTLRGHTGQVYSVSFSPDGKHMATASQDGTAKIWDITPDREVLTLNGYSAQINAVAFSSDGRRIATGSLDGFAKIWDVASGQILLTVPSRSIAGSIINDLTFNPDGTRLVTAYWDGSAGTAKVWDSAIGQQLLNLFSDSPIYAATFSPDGTRLATANRLGTTVEVWDAGTGNSIFSLSGNTSVIRTVAYSPDGTHFATGSNDGIVKVWDASNGTLLQTFPGHTGIVWNVVFSPDGTRLASASADGTGKVWDAATGKELLTLIGHANQVRDIAFSLEGQSLITSSDDGSVKIWDAATGKELLTLVRDAGPIASIALSPDGKRLLTGNADGSARIYFLRVEDLIALAKSRVKRSLTTAECQKYLHVDRCP